MTDKEKEEFKCKMAVLKTLEIKIKDSPYTRNEEMIDRKKKALKKEVDAIERK